MFETFNVPYLYLAPQAVLSLYGGQSFDVRTLLLSLRSRTRAWRAVLSTAVKEARPLFLLYVFASPTHWLVWWLCHCLCRSCPAARRTRHHRLHSKTSSWAQWARSPRGVHECLSIYQRELLLYSQRHVQGVRQVWSWSKQVHRPRRHL